MQKITLVANKENYRDKMRSIYEQGRNLVVLSGEVDITIKEHALTRSVASNRLYWLWLSELAAHMETTQGIIASSEDWHEVIVEKLLPMEYNPINNKPRRASTSKLKVKEFTEFLERLEAYCANELDLLLPRPEELAGKIWD